ncbi:M24 family metallopeptidase [Azospirillum sp. B4]|uniref:M24 family metallopeptidase n=1 Tax=Azospirillum sp. B4 TaxID=95605 RepID=UPI00034926BD|nr:M24 family metallopeptidase [Azospirillum sp. B4]
MSDNARLAALMAAEAKAMALLDAIETRGLIAPGRTERAVERDIYALAEAEFGVAHHWHKRIVRAGANTVSVFSDNPPVRAIGADDLVFLDLGPVFEEWEADVGRTYVLGDDPEKHRLVHDLDRVFTMLARHFHDHPDITGAELYAHAQRVAEAAGWVFGGAIAGHLVGEFPHARWPGEKDHYRVNPANPTRMRDPDAQGQEKHWILEVHLVNRARTYGGFYERLLPSAKAVAV